MIRRIGIVFLMALLMAACAPQGVDEACCVVGVHSESTVVQAPPSYTTKVLKEGQIYILQDEQVYAVQGQAVK